MIINVASKNPVKINAVRDAIEIYSFLRDAHINSIPVASGVSEQPISLEETIEGAVNRAKSVFVSTNSCDYSFGIESGLMNVPYTKTGSMNFGVCAIYDGKVVHLGLSQAFELPYAVVNLMREKNLTMGEAAYQVGLTKDRKIKSNQGIIGLLTKGRIRREDYIKASVQMALIHLENPHLY